MIEFIKLLGEFITKKPEIFSFLLKNPELIKLGIHSTIGKIQEVFKDTKVLLNLEFREEILYIVIKLQNPNENVEHLLEKVKKAINTQNIEVFDNTGITKTFFDKVKIVIETTEKKQYMLAVRN